jgi:hypothetical protein
MGDINIKTTFIVSEEEENKKKQIVDSRWEELRHIIERKLEGFVYINCYSFRKLFYAWGLDEESMWYAFAKYAAEHPG